MGLLKGKLQVIVNYSQTQNIHYTLAKYMLINIQQTTKMPINKVVESTLVSKTSVLKFCQFLGYDSWKSFTSALQEEYLDEMLRLNRLKMNAKLLYPDGSMTTNVYDQLQKEYLLECNATITSESLEAFVKQIDACQTILLLGDIKEMPIFSEMQTVLASYKKNLKFAKLLNKEDLDSQIEEVDENTLVIFTYTTMTWRILKEHYMLNPFFDFEGLLKSKARIIFIGQKAFEEEDNITSIVLPFSFNEYFIRLALQDLIYRVIHLYIINH